MIARHGQSAGNVARDVAEALGHHRIDMTSRDVDVQLSDLGREQSYALGRWLAGTPGMLPDIILASPYARAVQTAENLREAAGLADKMPICIDERLREKEFGILDGLTASGVAKLHPEQADFRATLGKFYHRPPGGESWVDVIFRLRALMDTVSLHHGGRRVLIVAHQVVVLCLRYIIEKMTETQILEIDRAADVANCAITEYCFSPSEPGDGNLVLVRYNVTAPLDAAATPVTDEPDKMVAARG